MYCALNFTNHKTYKHTVSFFFNKTSPILSFNLPFLAPKAGQLYAYHVSFKNQTMYLRIVERNKYVPQIFFLRATEAQYLISLEHTIVKCHFPCAID